MSNNTQKMEDSYINTLKYEKEAKKSLCESICSVFESK